MHLVALAAAVEAVRATTGGGEDGNEVELADHRPPAELREGARLTGQAARRAERASQAEDGPAHLRRPVEGDDTAVRQHRLAAADHLAAAAAVRRAGLRGEEAVGGPQDLAPSGRRGGARGHGAGGQDRPEEGDRDRGSATIDHVESFEDLPDTRTSLVGHTDEGDEAWLIRSVSQKVYRCPGCHSEIGIGAEHVVVQYVHRIGGTEHHHWHRACATEILLAQLRGVRRVAAGESRRGRLEARGRRPAGRRRRPR